MIISIGIGYILVYFQVNSNYEMMQLSEAMEGVYDRCEHLCLAIQPNIIFGVSCDNNFGDAYVKASIFVGYTEKRSFSYANNVF
ncbi:MAG: hypothetical protein JJW00_01330 [Sulfurimonas sp.]|nr:hypothetical protein [Sulfurimonas sp.]